MVCNLPLARRRHRPRLFASYGVTKVGCNSRFRAFLGPAAGLIPNRGNQMWMDPQQPGIYLGQCAQHCGTQHAKMLLRVSADNPPDFEAWVWT